MSPLRSWYHTAKADLLVRLRDRRLLAVIAACVYLGHLVTAGQIELTLAGRGYRGVENAAWMGTVVSLTAAFMIVVVGFYLVRGALARDRQARTAPLVATTPVGSAGYLTGKWMSSTLFLVLLAASMAASVAALLILQGTGLPRPLPIVKPFVLLVVPAAAVVAAVALACECLPGLGGTVGGILYFFVAMAVLARPVFGGAPVDLLGMETVHESMRRALVAQYPAAEPDPMFSFGYYQDAAEQLTVFQWEGVAATGELVAHRLGLILAGWGIVLGAALPFSRFDPSPAWWARFRGWTRAAGSTDASDAGEAKESPVIAGDEALSPTEASSSGLGSATPTLGRLSGRRTLRPLRLFVAECRRALSRRSWPWRIGVLGLIAAGLLLPNTSGVLVVAWLWPMPLWSDLGVREKAARVEPLVATSLYPRAQRVAAWAAGAAGALVMIAGPLLLGGHWRGLVGVLFVPALALAAGRLSGTPRLFEIVYLVLWYVGVANQQAVLDFGGVAGAPLVTLIGYGLAAGGLLFGAVTWRQ